MATALLDPDILADGARWTLVAVFALSAFEKVITLHARSAAWHPVMIVSRRRRTHAPLLMAAALLGDATGVALLVGRPYTGGLVAALLLSVYSVAGVSGYRSPGDRHCRCVWKILDTASRLTFLSRNVLLFLFAVAVALVRPTSSVLGLGWGLTFLVLLTRSLKGVDHLLAEVTSGSQQPPLRQDSPGLMEIHDAE